MNANIALKDCFRRCRQLGVPLSRYAIVVNIGTQAVSVYEKKSGAHCLQSRFRCSTSRFGIGQREGTNRTPLGLHRVVEKIGGGWPVGTVFKGRKPIGFTWQGMPDAKIATRILWLEGLEPGFNRGGNVDSYARYIYIHGTGDETTLGWPASCGCIHLAADDLVPLFDELPNGTLVWIAL